MVFVTLTKLFIDNFLNLIFHKSLPNLNISRQRHTAFFVHKKTNNDVKIFTIAPKWKIISFRLFGYCLSFWNMTRTFLYIWNIYIIRMTDIIPFICTYKSSIYQICFRKHFYCIDTLGIFTKLNWCFPHILFREKYIGKHRVLVTYQAKLVLLLV